MDNTRKIDPYTHEPKKGVSWRVIIDGTLTVLSILLVLNLIALFAGGFVAALIGISLTDINGVVQGIMTWDLYALISAWLLTTVVGTIISDVRSAVGGVVSTTGVAAGDAFAPEIEKQVEELDKLLDGAKYGSLGIKKFKT